jgi:hypothetical protein
MPWVITIQVYDCRPIRERMAACYAARVVNLVFLSFPSISEPIGDFGTFNRGDVCLRLIELGFAYTRRVGPCANKGLQNIGFARWRA